MVDGKQVESNWRSHQMPFSEMREKPEHVHLLSEWMKNYKPQDHNNIHVRGCKEEGTTTTPFDICVLNNIDRYQLTWTLYVAYPGRETLPIGRISRTPKRYSGPSCTSPNLERIYQK